MNPRLRRLFRRPVRVLAALIILFVLGSIALWIFRTNTLESLAKHYLSNLGFEAAEFTITGVQPDSLVVQNIRFSNENTSVLLEKLELTFTLSDLIRKQRIKTLTLTRANATFELPEESADSPDIEEPYPELADILNGLDLSDYIPLPFDRIQIVDSHATLNRDQSSYTSSIDAEITAQSNDSLLLKAKLLRPKESLAIEAKLSSLEPATASATLQLSTPIETLNEQVPDWKEPFPDLKNLKSGPLEIHANLSFRDPETPELNIELTLEELEADYSDAVARIPSLSASSTFSSLQNIPIQLAFTPEILKYDTTEIAPRSLIKLSLNIRDQSVVDIQTQVPIAWNYDTGFIQARSTLKASYSLSQEEQPLKAELSIQDLLLDGTSINPFSLTINGSPENLSFESSPIALSDNDLASIDAGTGTLLIPESDTDPITLTFSSKFLPAPLSVNGRAAPLPPFDLSLTTRVFEASSQSQIELTSLANDPLLSLPEFAEVKGRLHFQANLTQDSVTERFSGELKLDASEISIQSESISGNGIELQSKLAFQDIDTEQLAPETPLDKQFLTDLLNRTITNIDWQANQLQSQSLNAQWSGGSITLQANDDEILATTAIGSGILAVDKLKLDQLYLENEYRGNLDSLEGKSTLSALLDGSPIEVSSQQKIADILSSPSLTGEYSLSPISFLHSDLLARFAPEIAGLSFSAETRANGSFHASPESADASLSLTLRQGSLEYPASQLSANGLEVDLELDSLAKRDSAQRQSRISISSIEAGDAHASDASVLFRIQDGALLAIEKAEITLFGGQATLNSTQIPIDGSDFQGELLLQKISLDEIARYIEVFDGQMDGRVSGYLPFRLRKGAFELLRGELSLPDGSPATLRYQTKGLLTKDEKTLPHAKPTFSEKVLKYLKVNPDLSAEQALGNITITDFQAELFPSDSPDTPIRLRIAGIAHSELADIPVVISTQVHGSLSELYNFLIRLNSL